MGLIALTLAAAAAAVAPDDWPTGAGTLRVEDNGEQVIAVPVAIGDPDEADLGDSDLSVIAPDGFSLTDPISIEIRRGSQPLPANPRIELELPDGSIETVPVLARSDALIEGQRRAPEDTKIVLVLLAVVVVLWVSELVPLHVTSLMIPVVLAASGTREASDALSPFFDPIIVLFFAGFLMAEAMARVGLDRTIATRLVARSGSSPVRLYTTLLVLSSTASMWMSNTAAVALLVPIALTVSAPLGSRGYQRALVLGIAYAATIGGVGSPIGTPANQLAIRFLDEFAGQTVSFVGWFGYGLPLMVLMLPVIGAHVWRRLSPEVDAEAFSAARVQAQELLAVTNRLPAGQIRVLILLVAVLVGWLTETWHDVSTGIVGLAGAVAMMITGDIRSEDLSSINWSTLLTFGGGLTLGLALVDSGTSDYVVSQLAGIENWPSWLAVLLIASVTLSLTTIASNTAAAATLIPLAIPLAGLIGADPVLLTVVVALASSIDFALVIGTPPTMLAHSTGLFTAREILRIGAVLDLMALLLLVGVVTTFWSLVGLT